MGRPSILNDWLYLLMEVSMSIKKSTRDTVLFAEGWAVTQRTNKIIVGDKIKRAATTGMQLNRMCIGGREIAVRKLKI